MDASEDIVLASRRDQSRRLADRRRHSMVGRKLHRSSADGSQPPSRRHSIQPVSRSTTPPFSSPSCFFFLFLSLSPSLSRSEGCTRSSAGAGEINHARNLSRSRQKISSAVGLGSNERASERANDGVMDNRRDLSIGRRVATTTCRPGGLAARAMMGVSLRRRDRGFFFSAPLSDTLVCSIFWPETLRERSGCSYFGLALSAED